MSVQSVGINNAVHQARIREKNGTLQSTVASVDFLVSLARKSRRHAAANSHAGAMLAVLDRFLPDVHGACFAPLLSETCSLLQAEKAQIKMSFPFFLSKQAPVSRIASLVEYRCGFAASLTTDEAATEAARLRIIAPVTTLCPCSREISRFGAHNQRATISLTVQPKELIWLEDLIDLVEGCGSAGIYTLLKREDEKYVTEQAYEHPMFVEDVARAVAQRAGARADIAWFAVGVESFESIHTHSAYAFIDSREG